MAENKGLAPIIIIKKHGKHKHAHHGGSWKVAFADFATAMMAFFLVMWLLGSTSQEERQQIQEYFLHPENFRPIRSDVAQALIVVPPDSVAPPAVAKDYQVHPASALENLEETQLEELKETLEKNFNEEASLKSFKDQIIFEVTPEGLRIQLIDKDTRPMFDLGSSNLLETTALIIDQLAKPISKLPNKVSISGHTDAKLFKSKEQFTNWELSADRANAARRALVAGGVDDGQISRVVGLSSTVLLIPTEPESPLNRRISIIVLNKATEKTYERENQGFVTLPKLDLPPLP